MVFVTCKEKLIYGPMTVDLADKPLEGVKIAITGKWIWHLGWLVNECEWHSGECITTGTEQPIDNAGIVSYTFNGSCFLIEREDKSENICHFDWQTPEGGSFWGIITEDEFMSRTFIFQAIEKDTLTVQTFIYMPNILSKSEIHKLVKQR